MTCCDCVHIRISRFGLSWPLCASAPLRGRGLMHPTRRSPCSDFPCARAAGRGPGPSARHRGEAEGPRVLGRRDLGARGRPAGLPQRGRILPQRVLVSGDRVQPWRLSEGCDTTPSLLHEGALKIQCAMHPGEKLVVTVRSKNKGREKRPLRGIESRAIAATAAPGMTSPRRSGRGAVRAAARSAAPRC